MFVLLQQCPFLESLEVAERAEYHVMSHPQTFPRGLAPDYRAVGTTLSRKGKTLFAPQGSLTPSRPVHKATAVFGHAGGRLVVPNTGEPGAAKINSVCYCVWSESPWTEYREKFKSMTYQPLKQRHSFAFLNGSNLSAVKQKQRNLSLKD